METLEKMLQGECSHNHYEGSMTLSWVKGRVKLVAYRSVPKIVVLIDGTPKVVQNDNRVNSIEVLTRQCCEVVKSMIQKDKSVA